MGNRQRTRLLSGKLTDTMSFVNPVNKSFCLEQVCESNYQKLLKLIPDLMAFEETAIGLAPQHITLHLEIIERTPYTLTLELSHCFHKNQHELLEPAVRIRLYLDAQLAEVLSDLCPCRRGATFLKTPV